MNPSAFSNEPITAYASGPFPFQEWYTFSSDFHRDISCNVKGSGRLMFAVTVQSQMDYAKPRPKGCTAHERDLFSCEKWILWWNSSSVSLPSSRFTSLPRTWRNSQWMAATSPRTIEATEKPHESSEGRSERKEEERSGVRRVPQRRRNRCLFHWHGVSSLAGVVM